LDIELQTFIIKIVSLTKLLPKAEQNCCVQLFIKTFDAVV